MMPRFLPVFVLFLACGCSVNSRTNLIATQLAAISGPIVQSHADTYRDVLHEALSGDAYPCFPLPSEVFSNNTIDGDRVISGTMPHYGIYYGPMHYVVRHYNGRYRVEIRFAVVAPSPTDTLQMPDCNLRPWLQGPVVCEGIPFAQSNTLEACPDSGKFEAIASPHNVAALLSRWSVEAEQDYNRDALAFGIPVTYDFHFELTENTSPQFVDMQLPLATNCARLPYFTGFHSAWSPPIVAHEIGHVMGLLDEYQPFSGLISLYPKTPYKGCETSRMGLSMKTDTRFYPIHHYLILRRFLCQEPKTRNPYAEAFR